MTSILHKLQDARLRAYLLFACIAVILGASTVIFRSMHEAEPIIAGPGVTQQRMLSHYAPGLTGTAADTPVFILEGKQPGATMVVLGGTHPQEISGLLGAVLLIENAQVQRGRLIIIPQSNRSGFNYTEPLEGFPHTFTIQTAKGERWFRNGMRLTNPVDQWPDPDLYLHDQSKERMVGWEGRNLNRNFPGNPSGRYTERLAHAIMTLAEQEKADMVFDMHEAYPEYPIINMMVAHQRAFDVATNAMLELQMRDIPIDLMPSPLQLRGLSHREFGDRFNTLSILSETANPAMGRFRGRMDDNLLVEGMDDNYVRAAALGRLFVPFTEKGHPLSERTARQVATVEELINAFNSLKSDAAIVVENIPAYEKITTEGLGQFLLPPPS